MKILKFSTEKKIIKNLHFLSNSRKSVHSRQCHCLMALPVWERGQTSKENVIYVVPQHITLKVVNKIDSEIKQDKHLFLVHFWCAHEACCKGVPLKSDYPEHILLFQVNAVTIDGITPLFNACCSGSVACVNMLLEFGAKPQLRNHLASPIHEAVKRGNIQAVSEAIDN